MGTARLINYLVVRNKRKAYKTGRYLEYHSSPQYDLHGGNAGPSFSTHSGGYL